MMLRTKVLAVLFTIFSIISCQKKEEFPLLAHHIPQIKPVIDSLLITIPFDIGVSELPDTYLNIKKNRLTEYYDKIFGTNDDFSGGFLVAKNGKIIYEKYSGFSNYEKEIPMSDGTPLHLASISKVFTATAILKLVQDEKINLDEKVKTYLPDFPYQNTTVRTLLNHRSGLPHYSRFKESVKGWNSKKALTNQDVLNYLKRYRFALLSKNNTRFNYCNTNYAMLALIIESVSGKSYSEAMNEIIFEPLGMQNTFVFDFFSQKDNVSQSYLSTRKNYGWDEFDAIYGDKNIYSTPRDLIKFDLASYSPDFLKKELWDEALKGYSYEKKGEKNYGLGIRMREWKTGQALHYHNGWWHGNTSSYVTLKKDTVAIIALSNKYTKKPYQIMKLSALFGDYPFDLDKDFTE